MPIKEYEERLLNIPADMLREVEEYERREYSKQNKTVRRRYPRNEDVVDAIKNLTNGLINRYTIENLYDSVIVYLKEKGFDISALNENRFWRLVTNLVKKGQIKLLI